MSNDQAVPDVIDIQWQIAMNNLKLSDLQKVITEGEQEVKKREQEIAQLTIKVQALQDTLASIKSYVSSTAEAAIAGNSSPQLLSFFEQAIEQGREIRATHPDVVSEALIDGLCSVLSELRGDERSVGGL